MPSRSTQAPRPVLTTLQLVLQSLSFLRGGRRGGDVRLCKSKITRTYHEIKSQVNSVHSTLCPSCLFLLQEYPGKVRRPWRSIFVAVAKIVLGGVIIMLVDLKQFCRNRHSALEALPLFLRVCSQWKLGFTSCSHHNALIASDGNKKTTSEQ
jgi:hypothetical protein